MNFESNAFSTTTGGSTAPTLPCFTTRRDAWGRRRRPVSSLAGALLLAFLSLGCDEEGSGIIEQRTFDAAGFDRIELDDGFHATVLYGADFSVQVFADDNLIDDVEVTRRGDQIEISLDRDHVSDATLQVEITMPVLSRATIHDGSELLAADMVLAPEFSLRAEDGSRAQVSASSDLVLELASFAAEDGSTIQSRLVSERTSVSAKDGSHVELDGVGRALRLEGRDGSSVDTAGFVVENLLVELVDGSYASATVNQDVEGKLRDGSLLEVAGQPGLDVDTRDGSSVQRRDLPPSD